MPLYPNPFYLPPSFSVFPRSISIPLSLRLPEKLVCTRVLGYFLRVLVVHSLHPRTFYTHQPLFIPLPPCSRVIARLVHVLRVLQYLCPGLPTNLPSFPPRSKSRTLSDSSSSRPLRPLPFSSSLCFSDSRCHVLSPRSRLAVSVSPDPLSQSQLPQPPVVSRSSSRPQNWSSRYRPAACLEIKRKRRTRTLLRSPLPLTVQEFFLLPFFALRTLLLWQFPPPHHSYSFFPLSPPFSSFLLGFSVAGCTISPSRRTREKERASMPFLVHSARPSWSTNFFFFFR